MTAVTINQVLAWGPRDGYTRERLLELADGRESMTALDILDLDIPEGERIWAVCHAELIPEPWLHELACRFVESALPAWERAYPGNRRPHEAIAAKRAWVRGEITDEQRAAASAKHGRPL